MIRRSGIPVAAALIAALALAGCGGGGEKKAADGATKTPDAQATDGGTKFTQISPMTGLKVSGNLPNHPAMVVKIDNTYNSEPQVGLGSADMVVEELVEGGISRLATIFYSKLPPVVGPVRSARASDIGVIKPANAVLVASGAARATSSRLHGAGVHFYTEGAAGMFRDNSRHAPYNLFMRLPRFVTALKDSARPSQSYLPWGTEKDFTGTSPATNVAVRFSGSTTTRFQYSRAKGKYVNVNSHASSSDRFLADSVLVLRVGETDAGYRDPAGNPVPEARFFGGGTALLFHHGQVVRGTWSKPSRTSVVTLKTAAGSLKIPAGHVWIELMPAAGPFNAAGAVTFH
ncbi:MAG: DUF3048 domain-containing protein [Marmoricola sp.]